MRFITKESKDECILFLVKRVDGICYRGTEGEWLKQQRPEEVTNQWMELKGKKCQNCKNYTEWRMKTLEKTFLDPVYFLKIFSKYVQSKQGLIVSTWSKTDTSLITKIWKKMKTPNTTKLTKQLLAKANHTLIPTDINFGFFSNSKIPTPSSQVKLIQALDSSI